MYTLYRMFRCKRGSSAVEFALVSPLFLMIVMSIIAYGMYLTAAHSVQQLAADAARTAIAGLSAQERSKLATAFLQNTTIENILLQKSNLAVLVEDDPANPEQFIVSLTYDASALPIWNLYAFAMPDRHIRRFATIRIGGA